MPGQYPQFRLALRIFSIAGFVILFLILAGFLFLKIRLPELLEFSKGIKEVSVETTLGSLNGMQVLEGVAGAENLCFLPGQSGFFVSDLDGRIHFADRDEGGTYRVIRSIRPGTAVSGICALSDSLLAVVVSRNPKEEWTSKGGAVFLMPASMDTLIRISGDLPSANGLCADSQGNLYLASSNFRIMRPEGNIYQLEKRPDGSYASPAPLFDNAGLANGLFYDARQDLIFFSNTTGGTFRFKPGEKNCQPVYLKLHFAEACDDLCTDISGNLWMTDPGSSMIKIFNPGTSHLMRLIVPLAGQISSCRIRNENGHEMVYLTQLKKLNHPAGSLFDGEKVFIVPAKEILEKFGTTDQ